MSTSGDEHSLHKIGAGVMDSDAGGFTADEREQSAHMLKPLSSDMKDTAGFDDDDDDDEDSDVPEHAPPIVIPDVSKLDRRSPKVDTPLHPVPPHLPAPVKTPLIPKPRAFPSDKGVPSGKPVDLNRKRTKGKMVTKSAIVSTQPLNDSESDVGRLKSHARSSEWSRPGPSSIGVHHKHTPIEMPNLSTQGSGNCVLPVEPLKAVEQYDRSMDFIIQIFREMAGHNLQATDVANMLVIFRNQMRPWCLKDDSADWADAGKYMSSFAGTMESVIRSCAESARARTQQRSALIPPVIPSTPMQSPRRSSQSRSNTQHAASPPLAAPIEPPRQEPAEATADEMSDVHFNANRQRVSSVAPAGLHYNPTQTHSVRDMVPPPYAREPYTDEDQSGKCTVS
jgi:hypothetical protein